MKRSSETDLVKACLAYLKLRYPRGVFWRANVGVSQFQGSPGAPPRFVRFGASGMADIQGVLPPNPWDVAGGQAIFVECKSATGKQSPAQTAFETAVTGAGAVYILAKSIEDLEHELD